MSDFFDFNHESSLNSFQSWVTCAALKRGIRDFQIRCYYLENDKNWENKIKIDSDELLVEYCSKALTTGSMIVSVDQDSPALLHHH
jgi:hypothetical protein